MKTRVVVAIAGLLSFLLPQLVSSQPGRVVQTTTDPDEIVFSKKSLAGPRLGFTVVPGNSELAQRMEKEGLGPIISQFGWHFEHSVIASGNGPAFVIEFIPLLGGVEYGKPIGSLSLMFGIRMPSGYEFGVGPNIIVATNAKSGLIIAAGKTFDVQGVSIPLNLAYATSPTGSRIAFIVGYAI
jgi:hypothetical protein